MKDQNKQGTETLKKDIKMVQKVIIIIFVLIIVLDIIFALNADDPFPTVSQVIHDNAMCDYFVITWLWGVLTPQLFIVRKKATLATPDLYRACIVLALTGIILIVGQLDLIEKVGQGVQAILFLSGAVVSYYLWPNYSLD